MNEVFNLKSYNEEYLCYTNDKNEKVIKKIDLENNKEINIIFDTAESTDVMKEVINELTKYYIKDILKIHI